VPTTIPERFRGQARRDAAAFYLSQLSKGFLSGDLTLLSGGQPIALVVAEFLVLRIDVRQTRRATDVMVRVSWSNRDQDSEPRRQSAMPRC
jgi:hypothetical protein